MQNYRTALIELSSFKEDIVSNRNIKIAGINNINQELSNHFLIYEILNLTNGKYYIGQHETKNPLDKYMGSGHYLQTAQNKEGLSSFAKIILYDFDNYDDMNRREYEMVQLSDCYPYNPMSYNLMEGSHNGRLSQESINKANKTKAEHGGLSGENNPMFGEKMLDHMTQEAYNEMRRKQIENNKFAEMIHVIQNDPIRYNKWRKAISAGKKGIKLSDEHKKHVGEGGKRLCLHWWNNGITEIKSKNCPNGYVKGRIKKYWWTNGIDECLQNSCPDGYVKGRISTFNKPKPIKAHVKKERHSTKGQHIYNNGIFEIRAFECPPGFTSGMLQTTKDKIKISTKCSVKAAIQKIKDNDPEKYKKWRENQGKSHRGKSPSHKRHAPSIETKLKCSIGQKQHYDSLSAERKAELKLIHKLASEKRYLKMYICRLYWYYVISL